MEDRKEVIANYSFNSRLTMLRGVGLGKSPDDILLCIISLIV